MDPVQAAARASRSLRAASKTPIRARTGIPFPHPVAVKDLVFMKLHSRTQAVCLSAAFPLRLSSPEPRRPGLSE
jgi:hypothetical protein